MLSSDENLSHVNVSLYNYTTLSYIPRDTLDTHKHASFFCILYDFYVELRSFGRACEEQA